ncbi:MAG: DNA polymerase I [Alphaproteobacteria bacterium]|nr:DNA polymerase I [Alphaproteobacteria bacterium]
MATLTIIDGHSLLFRAYYGVSSRLSNRDGIPTNAVFGLVNMVLSLFAARKNDDVFICVFDAARENWRNEIYPEYKANRGDTPPDLIAQIPLAHDAMRALGMPVLVIPDVEADDVIATLSAHECAMGRETRIVSSDKDLMQLVSGCVHLYDGMREKIIRTPEVLEKFGVLPEQVGDVLSLMGDSSDNVPGVPGIGPKTAAELINQFGTLEKLYENLGAVKNERRRNLLKEHKSSAFISRQLVALKMDVPLPEFNFAPHTIDGAAAAKWMRDELNSNSLAAKIEDMFSPKLETGDWKPEKDNTSFQSPVSGFQLIQTESELKEFLADITDAVAIDTETTGLCQMTAKIVGISLATDSDSAYIPIRHITAPTDLFGDATNQQLPITNYQLPIAIVREILCPILSNPTIIKVFHNAKFDLHMLTNEGFDINKIAPIDDTMCLSYILNGSAHSHSLDELSKIYLGHDTIKFDSLFAPRAPKNFAALDIDVAAKYASEDTQITMQLYRLFRPKLDSDEALKKLYENCDLPLIKILMHTERNGVLIDQAGLAALSDILHKKLNELSAQIFAAAGREFNIASPAQLGTVLYDELKITGPKNKSTDAGALNDLIDSHEIIPLVLSWRSLSKLTGTYTDALPKSIGTDGRIHTDYHQASTNTGRLSSRNPNLQNIPVRNNIGAEIRKCFVAPAGRVLISADYSQIQLRMLAHIANIPSMIDAFKNGVDIHESTARKIFQIPDDVPVARDQRHSAKTVNFSIVYGVSAFGLARQLDIPVGAAREIIDSYMRAYPEINNYMEQTKQFATTHGYVKTPWGRRIELPGINNPRLKAYALRAAINAPIQGFEADLVRFAMVKLDELIYGANDIKIIMQVHDEIVFECDENTAEQWAHKIRNTMEDITKMSVPLIADFVIGAEWK